ncbi:phage tail tape measure protein [Pseudomonas anguilliseptica]|uniref:phage tail tape measure protein n=1 Tax=Pseudomonas anguilliseptica TaxID=53406 RepID=UPI00325B5AEE
MANNNLELALRVTADMRSLGVGLKQGEQGVTDFSRKGQQELRKLGKVSDEVRGHFADMAGSFAKAAGGLYIANKIKPGVAVAGDLQEAMLGVKTELMGSVDSALQMDKALHAMKSTAFDIQKSTPFDQAQIVNLQKELLKGGAKLEQIVGKQGAAAAAAALAAYEGIDAVMAGESLISIATPFNLAGDQFMMLANQAGAAGSASTASFASIAEGAKYAAGSMAGLGRDSKEMFALLATLDQGGLKGSMGGTSLSAFFRQAVQVDTFKDANGNLKSTIDILDTLRKRLDGMGTAKRADFLQKMFGDEGGRAAQILLRQGAGSYEDMTKQMGKAVGLQEKLTERLNGYNAQLESLRGTAKSTFATLFEPALDPLTKLISKTNEWTGALGEAAMENDKIGKVGTGIAAGVATGGLLYGGYHLLKGIGAGGKMLGALKGGTELAGGVAMGKALEEAAGVPSVYVVNMPKELGGTVGTVGKVADAAGDLLTPKTFSKFKTTLALLGGAPLSALPSFGAGAGAMATAGAAVAGAGAAGYGVGTLLNDYVIQGTAFGDAIGSAIAHAISPFSEEARAAIAANQRADAMKGEITIRIEGDQKAKVTQLQSNGGPDMNVYTGRTGAGR